MVPRVLTVEGDVSPEGADFGRPRFEGPQIDAVEAVVAPDGETAVDLLKRERFDAVVIDLALEPLDGWYLLAAVGNWSERPRVVAIVSDWSEIARARSLGADLCVAAGTPIHARALVRSTKEIAWPRPLMTDFPTTTKVGVSA